MEIEHAGGTNAPRLFNSSHEFALRTIIILNELHPAGFDLDELVVLNYLAVHTADLEGPTSLHPPLPDRAGELLVTRTRIAEALDMLRLSHLVDVEFGKLGVIYRASDVAFTMVRLMVAPYSVALIERSQWIKSKLSNVALSSVRESLSYRIGAWQEYFEGGA